MIRSSSWVLVAASLLAFGCGRSELDDSFSPATNVGSTLPDDGGDASNRDGSDGSPDGGPTKCATVRDCDDRNACTIDECSNGVCIHAPIDEDKDGFLSNKCGGDDCDDHNNLVHPGAKEICDDRRDNDCNGKTDCNDPVCSTQPECRKCAARETCGNGVDDDCDGRVDCADPDCALEPACKCKGPEICDDGIDNDCNNAVDCADSTCKNTKECLCRQATERCNDGIDNNCNNLIDCADPQCANSFDCSCNGRPPRTEVCNNHIDDDCDGKVDCADSSCINDPACKQCTQEICNNGIDDSCDGTIDCADSACRFASNCVPKQEICNNSIDDDLNGLTDCFDAACKNNPLCLDKHESCITATRVTASGTFTGDTTGFPNVQEGQCGGKGGEAVFELVLSHPSRVKLDTKGSTFDTALYVRTGSCAMGAELGCDDDTGGSWDSQLQFALLYPGTYYVFVDGFTVDARRGPDEGKYVLNIDITPDPKEICGNGVDDDGDRLTDCADPDCKTDPKCANCTPELGVKACTDGKDNDCDGLTDCADPDCRASDAYPTECCNGKDDNGNNIVDEFACRCRATSDCATGEICFTDTVFACSAPCNLFNGDICPFAAPGSTCNQTTRQCQYNGR